MNGPTLFEEYPTDNALYYGDCLDWMRKWDSGIVDLVYLDPPFNSKQNYNMLFSTEGGGDANGVPSWTPGYGTLRRLSGWILTWVLLPNLPITLLVVCIGFSESPGCWHISPTWPNG